MSKKFITTIVAAAIAVTSITASPVQAGDRGENRRLMIGLLTLGTIAAIVSAEENKKRQQSQARQTNNRYDANRHDNRRHDADRYDNRRHDADRHRNKNRHQKKTKRHYTKPLPVSCRRSHETRHGIKRTFGRKCLERKYSHLHRLPSKCFQRIHTYNGMRRGFGANCLRRHGFEVARY